MRGAAGALRSKLRAAAWCIGTQGFSSYLAAPIVNSVLFLARSPLNIRFFRDLPDAAAWLAPHTDGRTPQDLLRSSMDTKARLDRRGKPRSA
jgi:hypothetical protein